MDLIDRYLDAVRLLLPISQRADIVGELRDELLSRQEEREAAAGRPLSQPEVEALLRDFGHPILVAGRYGARQYLIGPELFAVYAFVLKIVLACVWGGAAITGLVVALARPASVGVALLDALDIAWTGGFVAIGVVTLIFAVFERTSAGNTILSDWRPNDLPRIGRRKRDSWREHVAGIVVLGLFVLWWTGLIGTWRPVIPVQPHGVLTLAPSPVWQQAYWPILALAFGLIAVHALKLVRNLRRVALACEIVLQTAMLAAAGYVLHAGHWVGVTGVGIAAAALPKIQLGVDIGFKVSLIVTIVAAIGSIGLDIWRLVRRGEFGQNA